MIGRRQVLKLCYPVSIASSNDFVKSQQAAAWKVELPAAYRWGLGPVRYRRSAHEEASCKAVWLLDRFSSWNFYIWNVSNMNSTWLICHEHSWTMNLNHLTALTRPRSSCVELFVVLFRSLVGGSGRPSTQISWRLLDEGKREPDVAWRM